MNFKKYITLLCGSLLFSASAAIAAPPFIIVTDTPDVEINREDRHVEVGFTITNNLKTLSSRDPLNLSNLPEGVYVDFDDEQSDAYCDILFRDEKGLYHLNYRQLEDIGDSCFLRLFVDTERADFSHDTLTINPKVCADASARYCSDAAGNHNLLTITINDAIERRAALAPKNVALVQSSFIQFYVEAEGYNADCGTVGNYTCYDAVLEFPDQFEDLLGYDTECFLDTYGDVACEINIEVADLDEFKKKFDFIPSPVVVTAYITRHDFQITGDALIKFWWDGVTIRNGVEQHYQYQSLEAEQNSSYPGVVDLQMADTFAILGNPYVEFCDYNNNNNSPACTFLTTCELKEPIGDNNCKLWFQAIEPDETSDIATEIGLRVTLGETYAEQKFKITYTYIAPAYYSLDLYAGIADTNLLEAGYETSILTYDLLRDDARWENVYHSPEGYIFALTNWQGDLVAGGRFGCSDGPCHQEVLANNVARFNGHHWLSLGEGHYNGTDGPVYALADGGLNLYVGGEFDSAGYNFDIYNVTGWNGNDWSNLSGGADGPVYALEFVPAPESECLFTGGEFEFDMTGDEGDLFIGGEFDAIHYGEYDADNVALYDVDTREWIDMQLAGAQGTDGDVYALEFDDTEAPCVLFVGGSFDADSNETVYMNNVGMWSPNFNWSPLSDNAGGNGVNGTVRSLLWEDFLVGTSGSLFVGGAYNLISVGTGIGNNIPASDISYWNTFTTGSSAFPLGIWTQLDGDVDDAGSGVNGTVYALTNSQNFNNLYLGGYFQTAFGRNTGGTITTTNVAGWNLDPTSNPEAFSAVDDGIPTAAVRSLVIMPGLKLVDYYNN